MEKEKKDDKDIHVIEKLDNINCIYEEPSYDFYFFKNPFLDQIYKVFSYVFKYIYTVGRLIIKIFGIYLLWILLHYFGSHIYIRLCVPNTIYGFIISPFLTSTPQCQALRWCVYNGANVISHMWVELGSWLSSNIHLVK